MKSILDKSFRYTNSANTNLKATFARIRREQKDDAHREALLRESVGTKVTKIGAKHGRG